MLGEGRASTSFCLVRQKNSWMVGPSPTMTKKKTPQRCFFRHREARQWPWRSRKLDCHVGLRPPRNDKRHHIIFLVMVGLGPTIHEFLVGTAKETRGCSAFAEHDEKRRRRSVVFFRHREATQWPWRSRKLDCHVGLRPPRNDKKKKRRDSLGAAPFSFSTTFHTHLAGECGRRNVEGWPRSPSPTYRLPTYLPMAFIARSTTGFGVS
jgi:hypothetical protein